MGFAAMRRSSYVWFVICFVSVFGFLFALRLPETGGICISPKPSDPDAEIVPGMAMRPFFGINPVLMDTEVRAV